MKRWIDPQTGRVWGSPPSVELHRLTMQAVEDEQKERAKTMTRRELWAARRTNAESLEWADDESRLEL